MTSNASWLQMWLVADAVLLLQVLAWTPLLDPGWADGRLHPLLKLPCLKAGSHLSLLASLMSKRGSYSPSPSMVLVSYTVIRGAGLALILEPWLPSSMGSTFMLMGALLSHWSSDTLSGE